MKTSTIKKLFISFVVLCLTITTFIPFPEDIFASEIHLGSAANYHIFANTVQLHAHTNGNIATSYLKDTNSGFGTNQLKDAGLTETSYIQKLNTIISSSWADPLIIGSEVVTSSMDNGNAIGIQTTWGMTKLDHIKNVIVNDDYIDFEAEFEHLRSVSEELFYTEHSNNTSLDNKDFNHCYIHADADNINVITITADELAVMNDLDVYGINMESETVIINVDMSGVEDTFHINTKTFLTDENGNSYYNAERGNFEESRLIWNFYNAEKEESYTGALYFQKSWMGTILAPNADITVYSNVDGTIICNSFDSYGETHRWDFSGNLPVSKSENDTEDSENTDKGTSTEVPDINEPGSDNTETPNSPDGDETLEEKELTIEIKGQLDFGTLKDLPFEEVDINLKQEEEIVDSTQTSEEQSWEFSFEDIPKYEEDGETEIAYTTEVVLPEEEWEVTTSTTVANKLLFSISKVVADTNAPSIEAVDRYFYLSEAVNGEITQEALLEYVTATDAEDGVLENGTSVTIPYYQESDFTSFKSEGSVTVTYKAEDSAGNYSYKTVTAHILDKIIFPQTGSTYIRYISRDFALDSEGNFLPSSEGGLEEASIWVQNAEYATLLKRVLTNEKRNMETATTTVFFKDYTVVKPGTGTWDYVEEVWVFNKDEIDAVQEFVWGGNFGKYGSPTALEDFYDLFGNNKRQ